MDCRDIAANKRNWYESFNFSDMEIDVVIYNDNDDEEETVTFPAKFEVCHLCKGKGTHVNPSIDSQGISMEEFNDDPDFAYEYFNGTYDVCCYECEGDRVVPIINEDEIIDDYLKFKLKLFQEQQREQAQYDNLCAQEREFELKMGGCW